MVDEAVAAVMRQQHGVIGRAQALKLGMTGTSIRWRLQRGEWRHGVGRTYRLTAAPESWWQRAMATLVAVGDDAVLSHSSAAFVLGIEGFARPPSTVDVTVPGPTRVSFAGVVAHQCSGRLPGFVKRGLRVTTLARTFVDLAGQLSEEQLEFALDTARVKHPALGRWFEAYLPTLDARGRPGFATLQRLLALRQDGSTESALEVRVWRALRRHGLERVARQFRIFDPQGCEVIRADFAWPAHRFVLHTDSKLWHLQEERMTRDAHQRMRLQELGWLSLVVTSSMLDAGDGWLDYVRTQLRERDPQTRLRFGSSTSE